MRDIDARLAGKTQATAQYRKTSKYNNLLINSYELGVCFFFRKNNLPYTVL